MSAEENGNLVPATNTQLEENAEFRGSKENQEDLLLTAQRYLNIFHQIHIFKAFKRAQFNKELIEMPEKIRKIVAMLPGGRVLLEYIEEIEKDEGIQDSSISALIEQQGKDGSAADKDNAYTLRQSGAPAVINAPIEISSDFTNLLKETFNTYSQNLQQLSANIQKIASQKTVTTADGKVQVMPDITDTITSLLKENAQQQTEVLKSFGKTLSESLKESKSVQADSGITDTIASLLKENAQQQNEVLKSLGATLSQTITDSKGDAPLVTNSIAALLRENAQQQNEVLKSLGETLSRTISASKSPNSGSDITDTITSLLKENAQQQNEVLKSLESTLSQTISKSQSADSDIAETVSSLLKENSRQQTEALKSFGETLSQAILQSQKELVASLLRNQSPTLVQVQAQAYASPLPQYKTEAQVIPQEVRTELPEDSSILPLPINSAPKEQTVQPATVVSQPIEVVSQPAEVAPQPAAEIVSQPEEPVVEVKAEDKIEEKVEEKTEDKAEKGSIFKAISEKFTETKNKLNKAGENTKNKDTAPKEKAKEEVAQTAAVEEKAEVTAGKNAEQPASGKSKKHKKKSAEQKAAQEANDKNAKTNQEEAPDNFVFALPTEEKADTSKPESKDEISLADFDFDDNADNISATIFNESDNAAATTDDLPLSQDNDDSDSIDIDFDDFLAAVESTQASAEDNQSDTLPEAEQPVSLSMDDNEDWGSAFKESEPQKAADANQDLSSPQTYDSAMLKIRDALNTEDAVSLDDISAAPVSLSPEDEAPSSDDDSLTQAFANFADTAQVISSNEADDSEWEYVEESADDASADDGEWEYVDENGNPVSPDDADGEWEYVDEDGNPVSADGDEEWEYVDENGNPISPDDADGEWEYVDENGNVVNH